MESPIEKTEDEWKKLLDEETYRICRKKGTEQAFTGKYWNCMKPGVYSCTCCGTSLFNSDTKFDSGTGWPSFFKPFAEENILTEEDNSFLMHRTEVRCRSCGAHLGHVFEDGPAPSGLRYCINSASLKLNPPEGQAEEK